MSKIDATLTLAAGGDTASTQGTHTRHFWLRLLSNPLWMCLLVGVLARIWLIVHTNGVMAGDEIQVGLQAEHILRGDRPVYYYAQPYMGSLEAYLAAFTFLFTGPSVWAMRIQTIFTGLLMTYLAWRLAGYLAENARLSPRLTTIFQTIAALVAGFPPLYDMAEEVRVQGGYMGAFVIMLWLLLCAYRLTQRWRQHPSRRELAWRWAGIGFLVGLGLWIDPLISYACVAFSIWIIGYFVVTFKQRQGLSGEPSRLSLCKEGLLFLCALPTLLLGFTPGIIWGLQNNWANITYILHSASSSPASRLLTIAVVTGLYSYCLAPRAMGGSLPTQPDVTYANPHIVTFGLLVVTCALGLSIASVIWRRRAALTLVRKLTALPLLYFGCASVVFCLASVSAAAAVSGCGPFDNGGRYVVPLVDALPFLVATLAIWPMLILQQRRESNPIAPPQSATASVRDTFETTFRDTPRLRWLQLALIVTFILYFVVQGVVYAQADPNYTFQATGCLSRNPTHVEPIVSYMQSQDIHYAWATGWIGDHITFVTNDSIVATKPGGRIASDLQALYRADRASVLATVLHTDAHPSFLNGLAVRRVVYRIARFYSGPGVDLLVITPLNQTLSPADPALKALFQRSFSGCI